VTPERPVDGLQVGGDLVGITRPPSWYNQNHLSRKRFLREVLNDVEVFALNDVVVVTGLGELAQEQEDFFLGEPVPLVVYPERPSHLLLAPAQSTGLALRVGNRLVV